MGMSWEDVVVIEPGKTSGEPTVVTVNCPDKAGLGCDLLRIVLEFGLYVTRGGQFFLFIFPLMIYMFFLLAGYEARVINLKFMKICNYNAHVVEISGLIFTMLF